MKTFFVVVSALVFLVVAALQAYRAYAGIPILVDGHFAVPVLASWIAAGAAFVLALGLWVFGRK